MKKFSFIAGLGCLATVGGVFAAWTFGNFSITQPSSLEINNITIVTDIKTSFKVKGTATQNTYSYALEQNDGGDGLVLLRTSEKDNDVELKIEIVKDDVYAEVTDTELKVTAKVSFAKIDSTKGSLLELDGAVVNNAVILEEEFTLGPSNLEEDYAFKLGGSGAINESYSIESALEAEAYIAALNNTSISCSVVISEVEE